MVDNALSGLNHTCDQIEELEKELSDLEESYSQLFDEFTKEKENNSKPLRVVIRIRGGCAEAVEIPKGIIVEFLDYDMDGTDLTGENSIIDSEGERVYWWEEENL